MTHDVSAATPALSSALALGNAAAAAALYAADARLVTSGSDPIAGRDQIEAYWRAGLAVGLARVELRTLELVSGPGTALELGRYLLAPGAGLPEEGTYAVLHRQEPDGSWRRAVDVFNPDTKEEQ
jgi:uncharacterized protein (TIGR02246 family)